MFRQLPICKKEIYQQPFPEKKETRVSTIILLLVPRLYSYFRTGQRQDNYMDTAWIKHSNSMDKALIIVLLLDSSPFEYLLLGNTVKYTAQLQPHNTTVTINRFD